MTTHDPTRAKINNAENDLAVLTALEIFLPNQPDGWRMKNRAYIISLTLQEATGMVLVDRAVSRVLTQFREQPTYAYILEKEDLQHIERVRKLTSVTLSRTRNGIRSKKGYIEPVDVQRLPMPGKIKI